MPTLDWIGKEAVVKHHRDVPYRLLEPVPELSCGDAESGNLIVQGDNLLALKALLPRYAGKVKCIYIDPPYNTGNEGWVYNDNVNSPEIRKWLHEVVGREGEDLSRHDKWLSMMYPRLLLLKSLLHGDGVIFISIGRDELGHLRVLCDEIFGRNCLKEIFIFVTEGNTENAEDITSVHDYVYCYSRTPGGGTINTVIDPNIPTDSKLRRSFAENSVIKNGPKNPASIVELPVGFPCEVSELVLPKDRDAERFIGDVMANGGFISRDLRHKHNARYPIRLDKLVVSDGRLARKCRVYSGWSSASKLRAFISGGCLPIDDDRGASLRYFLSRTGVPTYRREGRSGHFVQTVLRNMGSTEKDKNMLERMGIRFDYPKPLRFISYLINLYTKPGDIVLDSFAGSGTTGHAVLSEQSKKLNFILVEISRTTARELIFKRLKNVCVGYTETVGRKRTHVSGLGGGFQFCRLSEESLFAADGSVREDVGFAQLAEFIWFLETGTGIDRASTALRARLSGSKKAGNKTTLSPLIGVHEGRAIYLLYNGILKDRSVNGGNVLTGPVLDALPPHDGPRVIYAAACRLGSARLAREDIVFRQTPYALEG